MLIRDGLFYSSKMSNKYRNKQEWMYNVCGGKFQAIYNEN